MKRRLSNKESLSISGPKTASKSRSRRSSAASRRSESVRPKSCVSCRREPTTASLRSTKSKRSALARRQIARRVARLKMSETRLTAPKKIWKRRG